MSKCEKHHPKKCCHEDHFQCLCHKKCKRDCDCKEKECRCDIQLVKDCICCEWSVPPGRTQPVYTTGGFEQIFGSGFISFDCGSAESVIVNFLLGGQQVGAPIEVFRDSCVTFTYTKFDRITVTCPAIAQLTNGNETVEPCEGEICITTRYPVC